MISLFFIGFLILIWIWNLYYSRHWNTNLTVSLDFVENFVYTGDQVEMTEQIENRKKMMLPVLEVGFHMDKNLAFHDCENTSVSDFTYKRDIFALLGRQRVTRKLTLDCTRRGYYRIDTSHLTSFSILHRRRFSVECPADTELYVYAARTDVSEILVACERLMGSLQCAKRFYEDPFAFSSIREYTVTDPMNTINWKASARTGELMVNTFESTLTEKVMIYLDVEDSGILKYEHLTEASISVAASLAQKLIGRGMEVGICVNVDINSEKIADRNTPKPDTNTDANTVANNRIPQIIYIEPSNGKTQLTTIEQMLAKRRNTDKIIPLTTLLVPETCEKTTSGQTPDSGSVSSTAVNTGASSDQPTATGLMLPTPPEDAVIIVISKNAAQNRTAIEKFMKKEQQALWVIPYTRSEPCDITLSDNIHIIKREISAS